MAVIQADISGMRDVAARFRSMAGQLLESQKRTLNIVGGMGQDIGGMRITSLITQNMLNIQKKYEVMHDNLEKYASFLENAAETYGETDDALKRVVAASAGAIAGGAATGAAVVSAPPPQTAPIQENVAVKVTTESPAPVTGSGGYQHPDLDSDYYRRDYNCTRLFEKNTAYCSSKTEDKINCVYYARARASEVNGLDTYATKGTGSEIRANSIAQFSGGTYGRHDVYIERVIYDASGKPTEVVISDSNMGNRADGAITTMSYDDFLNYTGANIKQYTYF